MYNRVIWTFIRFAKIIIQEWIETTLELGKTIPKSNAGSFIFIPPIILSKVLLPHPEGPKIDTNSLFLKLAQNSFIFVLIFYANIIDLRYVTAIKHLLHYLVVDQKRTLTHLQKVVINEDDNFLKMDIHTNQLLEIKIKKIKFLLLIVNLLIFN